MKEKWKKKKEKERKRKKRKELYGMIQWVVWVNQRHLVSMDNKKLKILQKWDHIQLGLYVNLSTVFIFHWVNEYQKK